MSTGKPMILALAWIEAHCVVADGFRKGAPFRLYEDQARFLGEFYRVRGDAPWVPSAPVLGPAFVNRLGMYVGPQGVGKNPLIAAQVCLEGVGPALFAGFAGVDEGYVCAEHGCGCGWEYPYDEGEPRGMQWPTPLIQLSAVSEKSTENTLGHLRPMINEGPLGDVIPRTGEDLIRLPGGGRIDAVTSSAAARLGNPVTFASQDEVGIWTERNGMTKFAKTQGRGVAKMSGRRSLTTNAWDPTEESVAKTTSESKAPDVYVLFRRPPANLSFTNKAERRKLFRLVYPKDTLRENGGHVDLDSIDAEAVDLMQHDLPNARRFFGNELVSGAGKAFDLTVWKQLAIAAPFEVPDGELITLGFDGSRLRDSTALVATHISSGYQWPLGIWYPERVEGVDHHEVDPQKVDGAVDEAFERWEVWRLYADPFFWDGTVATWIGRYGAQRVVEWRTNRPKAMATAVRNWFDAHGSGELTHCALKTGLCERFTEHVGNAVRVDTGYREGDDVLWSIEKEQPQSPKKIDADVAAILSWEARADAIAAGFGDPVIWSAA